MPKAIEGYSVIMTGIGLERFRRNYKDQFMVVKHKFDAETGHTPTKHDDATKNFSKGSQWINDDGAFFICVDPSVGAARWISLNFHTDTVQLDNIESEVISPPFSNPDKPEDQKETGDNEEVKDPVDQQENPPKKKSEGIPTEKEVQDAGIDTSRDTKDLDEKKPMEEQEAHSTSLNIGDDTPPDKIGSIKNDNLFETPLPDDTPFKNWLEDANKIKTIGMVLEHIKNNTLHACKYFNEERAQIVKDHFRPYLKR